MLTSVGRTDGGGELGRNQGCVAQRPLGKLQSCAVGVTLGGGSRPETYPGIKKVAVVGKETKGVRASSYWCYVWQPAQVKARC